jgi:hypothetical protein
MRTSPDYGATSRVGPFGGYSAVERNGRILCLRKQERSVEKSSLAGKVKEPRGFKNFLTRQGETRRRFRSFLPRCNELRL